MNLETITIPFDFKVTKLEHSNWNRNNENVLAEELMVQQGSARAHIDNRIIIAFDKSTTSSVNFLNHNRAIMVHKFLQMLNDLEHYWHKIEIDGRKVLVCLILIREGEYHKVDEPPHEQQIGDGLREPDKAQWSHEFLQHISWISDGLVKPHDNPFERGIDGYIILPSNLCVKTKAFGEVV